MQVVYFKVINISLIYITS